MQAAILLAKFEVFEDELKARDRIAKAYITKIQQALGSKVKTPVVRDKQFSAWAQFTVSLEKRDEVAKHLGEMGVPTAVHYPRPLHLQPAFSALGYQEGAFPLSEKAGKSVMSLPMHPYLSDEDQNYIVDSLKKAVG
jgi:UDP-2-acetamido-2-deoxy-ribo-hexuluronate aminotransferase